MLEREPLEGLAADGQLRAFRHTGFWDCMDTYKDAVLLNDLWAARRGAMEGVGVTTSSSPGAYGLLGSWLVKALLERGEQVVVLRATTCRSRAGPRGDRGALHRRARRPRRPPT